MVVRALVDRIGRPRSHILPNRPHRAGDRHIGSAHDEVTAMLLQTARARLTPPAILRSRTSRLAADRSGAAGGGTASLLVWEPGCDLRLAGFDHSSALVWPDHRATRQADKCGAADRGPVHPGDVHALPEAGARTRLRTMIATACYAHATKRWFGVGAETSTLPSRVPPRRWSYPSRIGAN